ncbi:hypothetical protein I316_00233 [Kwoniella heveanensis BCC8398]|uniref:Uncharacterized protein n=1 Tax=Kwoniella heveanensis BCC8398 TaxID=1296120 RepID=A0A1B9H419_9TREE|nr:hypothetical protein I316_00233 [Kwoniella heveanensis BCC8398]
MSSDKWVPCGPGRDQYGVPHYDQGDAFTVADDEEFASTEHTQGHSIPPQSNNSIPRGPTILGGKIRDMSDGSRVAVRYLDSPEVCDAILAFTFQAEGGSFGGVFRGASSLPPTSIRIRLNSNRAVKSREEFLDDLDLRQLFRQVWTEADLQTVMARTIEGKDKAIAWRKRTLEAMIASTPRMPSRQWSGHGSHPSQSYRGHESFSCNDPSCLGEIPARSGHGTRPSWTANTSGIHSSSSRYPPRRSSWGSHRNYHDEDDDFIPSSRVPRSSTWTSGSTSRGPHGSSSSYTFSVHIG